MKLIISILFLLTLLFFLIRFLELKTLYIPSRSIVSTPEGIGLVYDEVNVTTDDGVQLNGWFIPSRSSRATILFTHGNGGNISHRLDKLRIFNKLDVDVLIYDYRGYGLSKGSPSEKGLYLDIRAMYTYLVQKRKRTPERIIAYGESLGGAVTVDLAKEHELGGIILEGSFTSIRDMAGTVVPFIPAFVYASKYDSLEKIRDIKVPKLLLHSIDDEIIPFEQGQRLFHHASEPKKFVRLHGGHNDSFLIDEDTYTLEIDAFISAMERSRK